MARGLSLDHAGAVDWRSSSWEAATGTQDLVPDRSGGPARLLRGRPNPDQGPGAGHQPSRTSRRAGACQRPTHVRLTRPDDAGREQALRTKAGPVVGVISARGIEG